MSSKVQVGCKKKRQDKKEQKKGQKGKKKGGRGMEVKKRRPKVLGNQDRRQKRLEVKKEDKRLNIYFIYMDTEY